MKVLLFYSNITYVMYTLSFEKSPIRFISVMNELTNERIPISMSLIYIVQEHM